MFQVKIYKTIWNKEKKEVHDILNNNTDRNDELSTSSYFYDLTLKFPPFIDLEIINES